MIKRCSRFGFILWNVVVHLWEHDRVTKKMAAVMTQIGGICSAMFCNVPFSNSRCGTSQNADVSTVYLTIYCYVPHVPHFLKKIRYKKYKVYITYIESFTFKCGTVEHILFSCDL